LIGNNRAKHNYSATKKNQKISEENDNSKHTESHSYYEDDFESVSKSIMSGAAKSRHSKTSGKHSQSYSMNFDESRNSNIVGASSGVKIESADASGGSSDKVTCFQCMKQIPRGKAGVHAQICKGAGGSGPRKSVEAEEGKQRKYSPIRERKEQEENS